LASEIATTHISQVIDNAQRIRALAAVSSDIELLSRTFYIQGDSLTRKGQRIEADLKRIATGTRDDALRRRFITLPTPHIWNSAH